MGLELVRFGNRKAVNEIGFKHLYFTFIYFFSDISGGYNPSMLDAMRFAMTVSNVLSLSKSDTYKPLNYRDAFFMATMGGAQGSFFSFLFFFSTAYTQFGNEIELERNAI